MAQYVLSELESMYPDQFGAVNPEHIYINNDPTKATINNILNNINNKIILLSNYLNIGRNGDEVNTIYDDTNKIQKIIDNCDINCEIIFDKNKTYKISNLLIEKSIKINLNGCHIIASPMKNYKALFYFKGVKTPILNEDDTRFETVIKKANDSSITLPIEEDCDIVIEDSTIVKGWDQISENNQNLNNYDENTKLFSGSYQGRGELNYYTANSNKVSKPFEFDYGEEESLYSKARISKVDYIKSPIIDGGGCLIEEVDLGEYTNEIKNSNGENMPSLFQFDYCENANIHDIYVNGWNYKVVSALYCKNMSVTNIIAKNAFRPLVAAHGYLVQFVRCLNTFASKNIVYNARHLIDYVNSLDGYSSNNHAYNGVWAQYITHGMGSNRITSENDSCMNCHNGWSIGNASFNGDYNCNIINPTFIGDNVGAEAIIVCASENTKIVNPIIKSKGKGIFILAGAKNTTIDGGIISGFANKDPINDDDEETKKNRLYTSILIRGSVTSDLNAYKLVPENVEIKNMNINNAAYIFIEMSGNLRIENNIIANTVNNEAMLRVLDFGIVEGHKIKDYFLKSNVLSSTNYYEEKDDEENITKTSCVIKTYMEPTGRYEVTNNFFTGKNPIYIPARENMIFTNNKIDATAYEFSKGITTDILQSSIIDSNSPSIYDKSIRTNVKGYSNNNTIIDIINTNYLALAYETPTTLETLIHKYPMNGMTLTIYSYNENVIIPLTMRAYRTKADYEIAKAGGAVSTNNIFKFRFATSDEDIVFPAKGGAITFVFYDNIFIETNRSFPSYTNQEIDTAIDDIINTL